MSAAVAWRAGVVLAFLARPWSCAVALQREWRPADDPYASVDPHGFGLMWVFAGALLCLLPVLWLLLATPPGPAARDRRAERRRSVVVLLVIATPMLMQLLYLRLPLAASWPVWASSLLWAVAVASACLNTRVAGPSVHGAFARYPAISWGIVIAIGAAKLALLGLSLG